MKTAILLEVLKAGGAEIVATGNFGSTQDEIAAALRHQGMTIYGKRDDALEVHHGHLARIIDHQPNIILDNGADLIATAIGRGVEQTRFAAQRKRRRRDTCVCNEDFAGKVLFPVIVINDTPLKQIGENLHAVGEGLVESFMRITNLMVNGRRFVVVGYGWCGRGCAKYLAAFGGRVAVVETDEIKALEAALDGFRVGTLDRSARLGRRVRDGDRPTERDPGRRYRAHARRSDPRQRRTFSVGDRHDRLACPRDRRRAW